MSLALRVFIFPTFSLDLKCHMLLPASERECNSRKIDVNATVYLLPRTSLPDLPAIHSSRRRKDTENATNKRSGIVRARTKEKMSYGYWFGWSRRKLKRKKTHAFQRELFVVSFFVVFSLDSFSASVSLHAHHLGPLSFTSEINVIRFSSSLFSFRFFFSSRGTTATAI